MIIDCHTHLPSRSPGGGEWSDRLALMDRHGINRAMVFPFDGLLADAERHNDAMAAFVLRAPERLIGFAAVNPRLPTAADEVRRSVLALGLQGVKLHPWLQGFSPLEAYLDPVAEAAAELGVPMAFHDGTPPNSTPLQIAALAERHPNLQVLLAHSGLLDLWLEAIEACSVPNVWLILCGPPVYALRRIVAAVPLRKILFGTDAGFGDDYQAFHRLAQVRAGGFPETTVAAILGGNAARLLRL